MDARFTFVGACAAWSVCVVFAVPGFAQTNSGLESRYRSALAVAHVYIAARGSGYDNVELPHNLTIAPVFRPLFETMLRRSPTFRRQSARIADAPYLTVVIENNPPPAGSRARALAQISRDASGQLVATIRVGATAALPELLAHELEHVIEQLDGVDLATKARLRSSGVQTCECPDSEAFETRRAVLTGQRVAREVQDAAR